MHRCNGASLGFARVEFMGPNQRGCSLYPQRRWLVILPVPQSATHFVKFINRRNVNKSLWRCAMARKLLSVALIFGCCVCYAYSQTPAFAIQGRILDVTSSAIAGAQITIIPSSHASDASGLSDQNGEFSLALLPGKYTIK